MEVLDFEVRFFYWFNDQTIKGGRHAEIKLNTGHFDVLYDFENDLQKLLIGHWTFPSILL